MRPLLPGLALLFVVPSFALAETQPTTAIVVLGLKSNPTAASAAPGATALVAGRLSEERRLKVITEADLQTALSVERQKQMLGGDCSDEKCITELSGAMGARYVVHGRIDRFGDQYVMTVSLYDSQGAEIVTKATAEVSDGSLPDGARQVADELLDGLGMPRLLPIARKGLTFGLRLSSTFIARLAALNPGVDVELGWRLGSGWVPFLQVGFNVVSDPGATRVTLVPAVLGLRSFYFLRGWIHPYWGLGLGAQFTGGSGAPLQASFSFLGILGVQAMLTEWLGVSLEGSSNLVQTFTGLRHGGLGSGFNLDLGLGLTVLF